MSCGECRTENYEQMNGGGFMEQIQQGKVVKKTIKECSVTLSFLPKPSPIVLDQIKTILSNSYGERLQRELQSMENE